MKTTKANFVENNVLDSSRFFCPALPNLCALFEKKHHLVNFVGFIAVFFWCPHFDEDMGRNERWKEPS